MAISHHDNHDHIFDFIQCSQCRWWWSKVSIANAMIGMEYDVIIGMECNEIMIKISGSYLSLQSISLVEKDINVS